MNKHLYIMMGLPGSGKSTYLRRLVPPECITGADALRGGGPYRKEDHDMLWGKVWVQLREWMEVGESQIGVDGTMLTQAWRMPALVEARFRGYAAHGVWMDTPLGVVVERNARRRKDYTAVPEGRLRSMQMLWQEPTFSEGFTTLTRVPYDVTAL